MLRLKAVQLVLIVEDDPGIQDVVRFLAEANDMRVVTADNCEVAIREAELHRPDIAVVDLGLPDRDGIHLIQKMRAWSRVPIIVLSARTLEAQRRAAFDAGADDYVTKPFSAPDLLARMRALLSRQAATDRFDGVL
ncbi:MAG: response regulator transcription factor [Steroidobacteraceae bacterium]